MPPRPAPPGGAIPPGPTLLQVQCGSCGKMINVHAAHLETLMHHKNYNCPACQSKQTIDVDPVQEADLVARARSYRSGLLMAAAAAAPAPPPQPFNPYNAHQGLQNMLRQAVAAGRFPPHTGMPPARPPPPQHAGYHYLPRGGPPPRPPFHPGGPFPGALPPGAVLPLGPPNNLLPGGVDLLLEEDDDVEEDEVRDTFQAYSPSKLLYGAAHPDPVVETSSLAAVEPPDITYDLAARQTLVEDARLSALQLEAVVYACQRHEQRLPSGARGGFFIGDGAGVGKGRTIAGLIVENWARGRRRHLWVSVGADLKFDARRDLDDAGATDIEVHALNKLPYGKLAGHKIGIREGVVFLTYSSLVSSSDRGRSRLKQLVEWCGPGFDGLIVFDESHKAKNLVPEAGGRATQVGLKVQEIQAALPDARVVYCSATGASEPRNMGYMTRLGLWGEGHAGFRDFQRFLEAVQGGRGGGGSGAIAALELVAMDMKAQGMYVCRTLSFHGAEFETIDAPLEEPVKSQYAAAAVAWNLLYREFLAAEEVAVEAAEAFQDGRKAQGADSAAVSGATASGAAASGRTGRTGGGFGGSLMWRSFWAAHQRFFRHMCMAAKVPAAVRMAQAALAEGKCVVIGLQSTGEARTADVVAERGEELDDFVSGPKELLLRLVDAGYPLPPNPLAQSDSDNSDSEDDDFDNERVAEAAAKGALVVREKSRRSKVEVRYKEFGSDEDIGNSSSDEEEDESGEEESEEEGSGSDSGSGGNSEGSGEAAGSDEEEGEEGEDGTSESSGADSDPEFDPTAAFKERQRQREEEDASLNTQQRAEKAADEEVRRQRRDEALQAYSAAAEARARLRAAVEALELPANPLDDLIDRLGGPVAVAEMTGRKGRLVRDPVSGTVRYEPRNASGVGASATLEMINVHERGLFLDGTKLVAVISEAASAGISLHADRRVANQRRRVHLTLELPWSADKAIQQFGRSHRANQASGPQYRLIFTPLGGERRFAAAVARRLQSLGALTQGDRRAGPSLAAFNYESVWGQRALREMYAAILEERPPAVIPGPCRPGPPGSPPPEPLSRFFGRARAQLINCGVLRVNRRAVAALTMNEYLSAPEGAPLGLSNLEERERGDVPRFLNRLLGLEPSAQADLFDFFQATLDDLTERARREGSLDEGVVDLKAHSISVEGEPRVLAKDAVSGATAVLYAIKVDRGLPFEAAAELLEAHEAEAEALEAADAAKSPGPTPMTKAAAAAPKAEAKGAEAGEDAAPEGKKEAEGAQAMEESPGAGVKREREDGASEGTAVTEPNKEVAEGQPAAKKAKTDDDADANGKKEDEKASTPTPAGPSSKAAGGGGGDVVDLTNDSSDSDPAPKKPKTLPWASGFYKGRQEVGGRVHMLLALKVAGTSPATFSIIRPGTGRARKPITLRELRDKYLPVTPTAAKPLWETAFKIAGEPTKEGRPGMRFRSVHIMCGAVMGCWGAAQRAMARKVRKAADRRMRVMRIATTGEESQRLVGMLVPEEAVKGVVAELEGGGADDGDVLDGDAARRGGGGAGRRRGGGRNVSIAEPAAGGTAAAANDVIVLE